MTMQATRWEILQTLQRQGPVTVRDLSERLGLTPTGVRQHLTLLQRDNLVDCVEERGSIGRPHYVFSLTEQGRALFPHNYDMLSVWLLDELRELEGDERVRSLLRRMGARMAEPHLERLAAMPQAERVTEVARILSSMGIQAEARDENGVFSINVFSCPYHTVVEKHPEVCDMELEWAKNLTGAPVRIADCWFRGSQSCTYLIEKISAIDHT